MIAKLLEKNGSLNFDSNPKCKDLYPIFFNLLTIVVFPTPSHPSRITKSFIIFYILYECYIFLIEDNYLVCDYYKNNVYNLLKQDVTTKSMEYHLVI